MKRLLLLFIPTLCLVACDGEKTYTVGEDAFCTGLEETSPDTVYCVDGQEQPINGLVQEYYPSGNIWREMNIKDGRENGEAREYFENGRLHVVANVVDGRVTGVSQLYNEDGKLYMEMNWVNGEAQDIKVYDESGNIIQTSQDL